jgi:hypothetical protein
MILQELNSIELVMPWININGNPGTGTTSSQESFCREEVKNLHLPDSKATRVYTKTSGEQDIIQAIHHLEWISGEPGSMHHVPEF